YGAISSRTNERWVPEADVQKIKNSLSWEPRINIEEGIIKTINWYKNNKHLYLTP
ncbi:CDP-abequose synthase, partial [Bacillus cereus]